MNNSVHTYCNQK